MKYIYEDRAKDKKLRISIIKENWIPKINISEEQLSRVIANIIDNAITYALITNDRNNININVSRDKENVFIKVSNYGFGILSKEKDLIFSPGYQTELSEHMIAFGLGLGLSEGKKIVEGIHRGKLEYRSDPTDEYVENDQIYHNEFVMKLPIFPENIKR